MAWLDKMSRSLHEVNYHGVVTFERGNDTQVMNISHSVASGTQSERMSRLTGDGSDVVRAAYRELARQRMERLMQEHAEHASLNSPQGLLPYARVEQFNP